jgi:hypothetical protein
MSSTLVFKTDELARGVARYGYERGSYPRQSPFDWYETQHTVVLDFSADAATLDTAREICYTLELEDLSGNTTTTPEACFAAPGAPPIDTPTPTPSHTPTGTPTEPPEPSVTPTVTPTDGPGGPFEPNDTCERARAIPTDGTIQTHILGDGDPADWVSFQIEEGRGYTIEAITAGDIPITISPFSDCQRSFSGRDRDLGPGVELSFTADRSGITYLRIETQNATQETVSYQVSVIDTAARLQPGALIIVAGKYTEDDELQPHIHAVTDEVYDLFQEGGYSEDRIRYLTTDQDNTRGTIDATVDNLRQAITEWAPERIGPDRPLTIFLMDHGDEDTLYIDAPNDEILIPTDLDAWLDEVEAAQPNTPISVIIEACYAGSFIDGPQTISSPGRVIITSTSSDYSAYVSINTFGADFSNDFLAALKRGSGMFFSFQHAFRSVSNIGNAQYPWIDADGNQTPNEPEDEQIAQQRGLGFVRRFDSDNAIPPYITAVQPPAEIIDGEGEIRATVDDDQQVERVTTLIYPPSYVPPEPGNQMVRDTTPISITLFQEENDWVGMYDGFDEVGTYRIVVYASDNDGLDAPPRTVEVRVGNQIYLPLIRHGLSR